ncbi:MAG: glycosyltransferase family 2 protein [Alphaproteobacteria bacterium]|nr:glycosyltransferase family 2 protein [Alphaproteobacteria bacterium]
MTTKKSSTSSSTSKRETLSFVIPCYNEEEMIDLCHEEITKVTDTLPYNIEFVYVNDGSKDSTLEKLCALREKDERVIIINLSRNFGKEAAMTAGIDLVSGDALIILDADLQDPPKLIPDLIKMWKETNADVVYGQRTMREGETWFKKISAKGFYSIMSFIAHRVEIPKNTGDFRLMNKRSIEALRQLREKHRFMKGLFAWIGYKQVALPYNRAPRVAGSTKWNYIGLWNLAMEGIAGFSTVPLKVAGFFGLLISFLSFMFAIFIIIRTIVGGVDVPGYASLTVMISFLSGLQLLSIGILGEYVGRIFGEAKKRPIYFIEHIYK